MNTTSIQTSEITTIKTVQDNQTSVTNTKPQGRKQPKIYIVYQPKGTSEVAEAKETREKHVSFEEPKPQKRKQPKTYIVYQPKGTSEITEANTTNEKPQASAPKPKPQKAKQPKAYIVYKPKDAAGNSTTDNSSNRSDNDEFGSRYKSKKRGHDKWESYNQAYDGDYEWDEWEDYYEGDDWNGWTNYEDDWKDEEERKRKRHNKRKPKKERTKKKKPIIAVSKISCNGVIQTVTWSETGGILKMFPPKDSELEVGYFD